MRIAIITWFKGYNYGTKLQAYALQNYLKNKGNEVRLINYEGNPSDIQKEKISIKEHPFYRMHNKIKKKYTEKKFNKLKNKYNLEFDKRLQNADEFLFSDANLTEQIKTDMDFKRLNNYFDAFICGSDQIWNPQILNGRYFLNFVDEDKLRISYAASTSLRYFSEFAQKWMKSWISKFTSIGLREEIGVNMVSQLIADEKNLKIQHVCDPTLLLSREEWSSLSNKNIIPDKPYCVIYYLSDNRLHNDVLKFISKEMNLCPIIIPMTANTLKKANKKNIEYGPREFLALIENADFVLTDSFHAMIFSLIFKKQFLILKRSSDKNPYSQNERLVGILRMLGIEDRVINKKKDIQKNYNKVIKYELINSKLEKFIESSKKFLEDSLS